MCAQLKSFVGRWVQVADEVASRICRGTIAESFHEKLDVSGIHLPCQNIHLQCIALIGKKDKILTVQVQGAKKFGLKIQVLQEKDDCLSRRMVVIPWDEYQRLLANNKPPPRALPPREANKHPLPPRRDTKPASTPPPGLSKAGWLQWT